MTDTELSAIRERSEKATGGVRWDTGVAYVAEMREVRHEVFDRLRRERATVRRPTRKIVVDT